MSKPLLILWVALAWPLPALIAEALGWRGIWGSGSALVDYLIPIPVAGGALHVPSFVLCGLLVVLRPSLSPVAGACTRALFGGVAIAGMLLLLNLQEIFVAWQAGSPYRGGLWQANPLGLFLTCDALVALLLTVGAPSRMPLRAAPIAFALLLLPLLLPIAMAWPRNPAGDPFRVGTRLPGEARGDELIFVFVRLPIDAPDFRKRAQAWAESPAQIVHPRFHVDTEDAAVMFTTDPAAAQRNDRSRVAMTLCLYEDGTPPAWLDGAGDCFTDHATFSDRWGALSAARPYGEPLELRHYFAARELCTKEGPAAMQEITADTEFTSKRVCRSLERTRVDLRQRFPDVAGLDGR